MNKCFFFLSMLIWVFLPWSAFGISLYDYTIPESYSSSAYLTGSYNFNDGNQEQASYNGFVSGSYDTKYSSIPFVWGFTADGSVEFERGQNETDESTDGYDVLANTYMDKYIGDTNFLGFGVLDAGYRKKLGAEKPR